MEDFEPEHTIWTPDDEKDLFRRVEEDCRMTKVKAIIVSAKYYPEEHWIMVCVRLSSGDLRSTPIHESCFSYGGTPYKHAQKHVVEKEMFKLEHLFNKAKGKPILIEMPIKKT